MPYTTVYTKPPGTIGRIFEWHENQQYDESGHKPVIVKPDPEEKKKMKKSLI